MSDYIKTPAPSKAVDAILFRSAPPKVKALQAQARRELRTKNRIAYWKIHGTPTQ
jgi:hypothetical protein